MQEGIHHLVCFALDVGYFMAISVVPSVKAGQSADVGACLVRCESSLVVVGHCSDVVVESGECAVMQVTQVVGDISLSKHSCLLQVAVGQVTSWIVGGHNALLDVF